MDKELLVVYPKASMLHFAPEKCLVDYLKVKCDRYVSADISDQVADTIVDITNIQFDNSSFDCVICSHVLAHVDEESKAVDEMIRVLKPGGRIIIMTTIFDLDATFEDMKAITPEMKLKVLGQDDIWRKHGRDFMKTLQGDRQGIEVTQLDYREKLDKDIVQKYCLGESSTEFLYIIDKK